MRAVMLGLIGALAASAAMGRGSGPVAHVQDGALRGEITDGVAGFKGVPFAAPPVGELRWRAPQPAKPWSGVRDATAFGPACAQAAMGWNDNIAKTSREDCLYLNVWTPARAKPDAHPLPVMVFLPGGAFHGGGAAGSSMIEPSYDGQRLAKRGVVVVSVNYRLGLFGFLAHPELTAESPDHASGAYAFLDQIAALQWVKANIAAFGGDPTNVTLMGQSAGAASVGYLMTSPLAHGLFEKAILHSGVAIRVDEKPLAAAEADGARLADALLGARHGAGAVAALRQRSAEDLLTALRATPELRRAEPHSQIIDGYVLPESPAAVFQAGREVRIPMLIGLTARDGDDTMGVKGSVKADAAAADAARPLAGSRTPAPLKSDDAKAVQDFYARYPDLAAEAGRLYANATDPVGGDAAIVFGTDVYRRCGAALVARWHARRAPTWRFEFSHGYEPLGATHLWDMMYLFGWLEPPADQPRDARLVDQMQRYWTNFAKRGDPDGVGLPAWPRSGRGHYLDFASAGAVVRASTHAAACDLYARKIQRDLAH